MNEAAIRYYRCRTCRKTATSSNPDRGEAAPEHVAHRGFDIGNCKGDMAKVRKQEWQRFQ